MLTQKIAMGNRPSKSPFFSSAFHDGSAVTWVTARRHANWEALTAAIIVGSALASGNNPTCLALHSAADATRNIRLLMGERLGAMR